MPGPWYCTAEDRDYFNEFPIEVGCYLEAQCYDQAHNDQGKMIIRVSKVDKTTKVGRCFQADFITASDEYYLWWMQEGEGKEHRVRAWYHLCRGHASECRGRAPAGAGAVHTDRVRVITREEILGKKIGWCTSGAAKKFVDDYFSMVRKARPAKSPTPDEVDWGDDDEEEEGDFEEGEEEEEEDDDEVEVEAPIAKPKTKVAENLERLKADVTKVDGGEAAGKKKRETGAKSAGSTSDPPAGAKSKKVEKVDLDPSDEGDSASEDGRRGRKRGLFGGAPSPSPGRKKRDRGPFGQGEEVDFDSSGEAAEKKKKKKKKKEDAPSSDSESESGFRVASSSSSQHLRLVQYAQRHPGRLASRLLIKMKSMASRDGGAIEMLQGSKTPAAATPFFLMVTIPQYNNLMTLRSRREMRTLSKALDLLALQKTGEAADLLAQRLKALERFIVDGNWTKAQYLELLPPEQSTLLDKDEDMMLTKEAALDHKLRARPGGDGWRADHGQWHQGDRDGGRDHGQDQDGHRGGDGPPRDGARKGKGKGKGKRGGRR